MLESSQLALPAEVRKFARLSDGTRSIRECIAITELAPDIALATMKRLHELGVLASPGSSRSPMQEQLNLRLTQMRTITADAISIIKRLGDRLKSHPWLARLKE
jgi:hypothetical protein